MTDPWDDAGRNQTGFVVTAKGWRVPVAAPASLSGWPVTPAAAAGVDLRAAGTHAQYRGVGPKGYQRSDPHVREQVCERLLLDPYLDASGIVVKVTKGKVALTGTVPNQRMRDAAFAAASRVATGAVDSQLQVTGASVARASRARSTTAGRRGRSGRKRGGRGGQR